MWLVIVGFTRREELGGSEVAVKKRNKAEGREKEEREEGERGGRRGRGRVDGKWK